MNENHLGKFLATVVNNVHPEQMGWIQVSMPDVTGFAPSTWCMPCMPVAGLQLGIYTVPMPGSKVFIEFLQGELDHPVWVGCPVESPTDKPLLANTAPPPTPSITLQTPLNNGIIISDGLGPMGVGGIVLKSASGAMIAINDVGITITNGKGATITMTGPTVDINFGALTVT